MANYHKALCGEQNYVCTLKTGQGHLLPHFFNHLLIQHLKIYAEEKAS
jgi:hypothetical protein